jgi:hypothetical protein
VAFESLLQVVHHGVPDHPRDPARDRGDPFMVRRALSLAGAVICIAFIAWLASHVTEGRAREHSEHAACIRYNRIVFAVNQFHGTMINFIGQAQKARLREATSLKTAKSRAGRKLRKNDLQTAKSYGVILAHTRLVNYEDGCAIPTRGVTHARRTKSKTTRSPS